MVEEEIEIKTEGGVVGLLTAVLLSLLSSAFYLSEGWSYTAILSQVVMAGLIGFVIGTIIGTIRKEFRYTEAVLTGFLIVLLYNVSLLLITPGYLLNWLSVLNMFVFTGIIGALLALSVLFAIGKKWTAAVLMIGFVFIMAGIVVLFGDYYLIAMVIGVVLGGIVIVRVLKFPEAIERLRIG